MTRRIRSHWRRLTTAALAGLVAAGSWGSVAQAAPAEGSVYAAGASDAVPGQYVVALTRGPVGSAQVAAVAKNLAAKYGGTVDRQYSGATRGFSARLSATGARRLAADPAVAVVEQDRVVRVAGTQTNPPSWGLDRIDQRSLPLSGSYTYPAASSVRAYVLDTGIRTSHTEFGGRAHDGWDFIDNDAVADDCYGHGTHVAGTIGGTHYGVAKTIELVAVRVLDCQGSGYLSEIIAGVDWVTAHAVKPAVANMSIGGDSSYVLDWAVEDSIASGVTYAVAAGNEEDNACYHSPARAAEAITVGATDRTDTRASFSNYGSCVDLFAPGVDIASAVNTSDTAVDTYDGTSMATPHVAGAVALLLAAHPDYTPAEVRDAVVGNATAGAVQGAGNGSPTGLLYTPPPPPAPAVTSQTMAKGVVGQAYAVQLAVTDARAGQWALSTGALPAGLVLSATGAITGTPIAVGSSKFTVSFADAFGQSAKRAYTITVASAPPTITTSTLAVGEVRKAYSAQLATADRRSGTWALTAGTLPAGLSMTSGGLIKGTPSAATTATVTVRFTDTAARTATRTLTVTVNAAAPVIATTALPGAVVGRAYSSTLTARDARGGSWAVTAGALPAGLSLAPTGQLTGNPTTVGPATFTIGFTDVPMRTVTRTYTITVASAAPVIATTALPEGAVGTGYAATLTTNDGRAGSWSATTGPLPAGLALSPSGALSGTPGVAGTVKFTVAFTDTSARTVKRTFNLVSTG